MQREKHVRKTNERRESLIKYSREKKLNKYISLF